jgi:nucleoid-associated protein YgaU
LHKEVEDLRAHRTPDKPVADQKSAGKKPGTGPQTYVVREGDTLASISRKFYKSSGRWKKIRDANRSVLDDPTKLKPGTTLTIP